MDVYAKYPDGVEVSKSSFNTLATHVPRGTLDVFASDQPHSYAAFMSALFERAGAHRQVTESVTTELCRAFAEAIRGTSTAAAFDHLAFRGADFRSLLGSDTLLIGRIDEDGVAAADPSAATLAALAVRPEDCVADVDAFKTIVKLDPDHRQSWEHNLEWLEDVYARCRKVDKPLFNETQLARRAGEPDDSLARRSLESLVQIAATFGPYGDFYCTAVPALWTNNGRKICINESGEVRKCAEDIDEVVHRPLLLVASDLDYSHFSAQQALVSDIFTGLVCGPAYFRELFTVVPTNEVVSVMESFRCIVLPRIRERKNLAETAGRLWWNEYSWLSSEARSLLGDTKTQPAVPPVVDPVLDYWLHASV